MKCISKILCFILCVTLCVSLLVNVVAIKAINILPRIWHLFTNSSSYSRDSGIYSDCNLISQNYSFAENPFDEIQLEVSGELEIQVTHQPHTSDASITTGGNLLQYIDLYVSDKTLYITKKEHVNFPLNAKVKIIVNTDNLKSIVTYGSCDSTINNIDTDNFSSKIYGSGTTVLQGKIKKLSIGIEGSGEINAKNLTSEEVNAYIYGSGNIVLQGETKKLSIGIEGSGEINAKNLTSEEVDAYIYGSGNIVTNVTKQISANINGSGSIDYYGTPGKVNFSGGGKIRSIGR